MRQCYRRLMTITGRVVGQARRFTREIAVGIKRCTCPLDQAGVEGDRTYLETMIPRVQHVLRQTRERIDHGNNRAPGKIVSLFEPHTEVIRKGKAGKPTEFGKMIKIQEAEQQIVTYWEGRWTAHDLRRTAATLMAGLGISGDVIDECLNHMIESRVRRTYIRDRRVHEQAKAFDALGILLRSLWSPRRAGTAQPERRLLGGDDGVRRRDHRHAKDPNATPLTAAATDSAHSPMAWKH